MSAMTEDEEFDFEFDWELPLEVVSGIFAGMGWQYDVPDYGLKSPTADDISQVAEGLIDALEESGQMNAYATLGRILVYKDPEFPSSYDVYLKLGHCSPVIPKGDK